MPERGGNSQKWSCKCVITVVVTVIIQINGDQIRRQQLFTVAETLTRDNIYNILGVSVLRLGSLNIVESSVFFPSHAPPPFGSNHHNSQPPSWPIGLHPNLPHISGVVTSVEVPNPRSTVSTLQHFTCFFICLKSGLKNLVKRCRRLSVFSLETAT
jgi:hypothetical protein